jgi:hypothetical protein
MNQQKEAENDLAPRTIGIFKHVPLAFLYAQSAPEDGAQE